VAQVYTAPLTVRHHEVDGFGRLHPAVYLRYLAHAAIEASSAAGFDAAWYGTAGTVWLIRRSSFEVVRPARAGEALEIRTWVEDMRRVRSRRRYELRDGAGELRLAARTDWVYVDGASGRPRRVPPEIEAAFAVDGVPVQEREPWSAPPPPAAPARAGHRVRIWELDGLGHVNNAVYLDIAAQAVLDVLEGLGWPLERLVASGGVPELAGGDLEYLEAARYGDRLEIATWFTTARCTLEAHQLIGRADEPRPLVRATTRWRWTRPGTDAQGDVPEELLAALRPLLAA
jgi:acyl-CoA thioester hydrolase